MPVLRPALFAALRRTLPVGVTLLSLAVAQSALAAPPPTGVLTYTGQLLTSLSPPTPASGTYDFQFQLFSAATGGTQVGATQSAAAVPVADGVFYAEINFGSVIGTPGLYLQTSYRLKGATAYTVQSPRKKLSESGYADYAAYASYAGTAGNTQGLAGKYVSTAAPTTGQVLTYNGTLWAPAAPASGGGSYTAGAGLTLTGSQFSVAVPLALSGGGSGATLSASNTGGGDALSGSAPGGTGVSGSTSSGYGGYFSADTGYGVYAYSESQAGVGGESDVGEGVYGLSQSSFGVYGASLSSAGVSASGGGTGVSNPALYVNNHNDNGIGLVSITSSTDANLVVANDGPGDQIKAFHAGRMVFEVANAGDAYVGGSLVVANDGPGDQIRALHAGKVAFEVANAGDVYVGGSLNVSGNKNFEIDHPLHPDTMTLKHACVESNLPENVYNGRVVTDSAGDATVTLPAYFEALNKDPLYQLTVVGQFAQAVVATEVKRNTFTIKTDKPGVTVCWQVTGERNDAYQKAHPYRAEEPKAEADQGKFLDPADYGQPEDRGIGYSEEVQAHLRPAPPARP